MTAVHTNGYGYWTEQDDATLRLRVSEGVPFSAIGAEMGRSKCSCIGRAHRLKLEVPPKPPSNSPKAIRNRAKRSGVIIEKAFVSKPVKAQDNKPQPRYEQPEASTTPFGVPRTLLKLEAHHCRFAVGERNGKHLFCCGDKLPGKPYCADHAALCYRDTERQSLSRLLKKAYR